MSNQNFGQSDSTVVSLTTGGSLDDDDLVGQDSRYAAHRPSFTLSDARGLTGDQETRAARLDIHWEFDRQVERPGGDDRVNRTAPDRAVGQIGDMDDQARGLTIKIEVEQSIGLNL